VSRLGGFAALAVVLLAPSFAVAQPAAGTPGRIEISGGVVWIGGYDAGSRDATESSNSSTGGAPLTLFRTSSRVRPVTGFEGHAAFYLSSRVAAEGLFQLSKPQVRVKTADDFENAAAAEVVGGISSYVFGGSLVYHFGSGKVVPFVLGGGAYLRLLDEDNAEVVTGNEFHGGGGVKVWFSEGPSRLGLRVDAQMSSRSKSAGFEDTRRVLPAVSAGLTYRF
jgi:hypothetical protein